MDRLIGEYESRALTEIGDYVDSLAMAAVNAQGATQMRLRLGRLNSWPEHAQVARLLGAGRQIRRSPKTSGPPHWLTICGHRSSLAASTAPTWDSQCPRTVMSWEGPSAAAALESSAKHQIVGTPGVS